MKWNHEIEFDNIANFLGKLFNKTPEAIKERFVNIPDMYVLAFKDDSDIKGVMVSIRNDKADNILETIYVAFEPDFNFKETNVFNKLNNFCKTEYIDLVFAQTISENSFVNVDIEKLSQIITLNTRVLMKLTISDYKEKWYDKEKGELPKISSDKLDFNKKFKVSGEKKSKKFTVISLNEVSWVKVAELQNKVYANLDLKDNLSIISKKTIDYNISLITKLFSGFYGHLSDTNSYIALSDAGEVAGYIVNLEPSNKKGFIADFAVDPSFQGYGLGKVLLRNTVIKYFEQLDCDSIGLAVSIDNNTAIEIYVDNGFQFEAEEIKEGILFID